MSLGFSDYLALFAVGLSVYTLYQTSRFRGGDNLLAAIKEHADMREALNGLDGAPTALLNDWKAILAARGQFSSGVTQSKEQLSQQFQGRLDELITEFNGIEKLDGWGARRRAEVTLAKLLSLRAKTNAFVASLDEERDTLRKNQEDFRNRRR
jgi:hypothetical protein